MVSIPIEWIIFDLEIVAREIPRRVPQTMELIPQNPLLPLRSRHNPSLHINTQTRDQNLRKVVIARLSTFNLQLDHALHRPVKVAGLGTHGHLDRQKAGPRPQPRRVREIHLEEVSMGFEGRSPEGPCPYVACVINEKLIQM